MKKILYIAISQGHLYVFHRPVFKSMKAEGWALDVAARSSEGFELDAVDKFFELDIARSPFRLKNVKTFWKLIRIMRSKRYDIIHCHTPVASALARVAAIIAKGSPTVIYTAHGFHFYPGAPLLNWALWFSLEFILTRLTSITVVMNAWDEGIARTRLLAGKVKRIPGMGVDVTRFKPPSEADKKRARARISVTEDSVVVLYVAEFIPRKNHRFVIDSFAKLQRSYPELHLVLAGDGPLVNEVLELCRSKNIDDAVSYLGFVKNIENVAIAADIGVSASRHEGLPIGILEMMAIGLPVVVSEDRGHRELVIHGETGYIFPQGAANSFEKSLGKLLEDPEVRVEFGRAAVARANRFSTRNAVVEIMKIYRDAIKARQG